VQGISRQAVAQNFPVALLLDYRQLGVKDNAAGGLTTISRKSSTQLGAWIVYHIGESDTVARALLGAADPASSTINAFASEALSWLEQPTGAAH
jgi:hypothetical protein